MNSSMSRLFFGRGLRVLLLLSGGAIGVLAACSNSSNDAPSDPVITTGGTPGSAGHGGESEAGGPDNGGSDPGGRSNATGGSGDGDAGESGAAGAEPGGGGSGNAPASCPTSDVGFYNQPSKSQKSPFDNVKRLGTHATLPPLP